jgi:predicted NBD/HSP70 family sugar kinase
MALRGAGTASRSELARLTGLSRTTVAKVIDDLQAKGLVFADFGGSPNGRGRPALKLGLDASAGIAVGIDFGHDYLRAGVADLASTLLAERDLELDVDAEPTAALDAAARLTEETLDDAGVDRANVIGVGTGIPAPLNTQTGTIGSTVILPRWRELDLAVELGRRLALDVVIENDANLGALGEAAHGAARGLSNFAYVQVSAGIGAGLVLGGRLYRGHTGAAGELGHIQVVTDGAVCRCGKRGCLETVATTDALIALLRPTHGPHLGLHELLELISSGDPAASHLVSDAGRAVGRVVADLSSNLDLEAIIVGGHLSRSGDRLLDEIRASIDRYSMPGVGKAVVIASELGERAEMLGALALVINDPERLQFAGLGALLGP